MQKSARLGFTRGIVSPAANQRSAPGSMDNHEARFRMRLFYGARLGEVLPPPKATRPEWQPGIVVIVGWWGWTQKVESRWAGGLFS